MLGSPSWKENAAGDWPARAAWSLWLGRKGLRYQAVIKLGPTTLATSLSRAVLAPYYAAAVTFSIDGDGYLLRIAAFMRWKEYMVDKLLQT